MTPEQTRVHAFLHTLHIDTTHPRDLKEPHIAVSTPYGEVRVFIGPDYYGTHDIVRLVRGTYALHYFTRFDPATGLQIDDLHHPMEIARFLSFRKRDPHPKAQAAADAIAQAIDAWFAATYPTSLGRSLLAAANYCLAHHARNTLVFSLTRLEEEAARKIRELATARAELKTINQRIAHPFTTLPKRDKAATPGKPKRSLRG